MLVNFNVDMKRKFLFIFSFYFCIFIFFNEKFIGERLQFYGNYGLGYISFEEFSNLFRILVIILRGGGVFRHSSDVLSYCR